MVTRTVLITGCSDRSLGAALAVAYQKAGWRAIATARNPDKLKDSVAAGIETLQLDVTSDESVAKAVEAVRELTGGSLDALINNAGAGYSLPILDLDLNKVRDLYELNVFALIRTTRAFFPLLVKAPQGAIIANNTSGMGLPSCALAFQAPYASSKGAAISLTEAMRLELAPFRIRVVDLLTGNVRSTFFDNAPKAVLPPNSLYNIAKEGVERGMSSAEQDKNGILASQWAAGVVGDLTKSSPPHWIFRGDNANLARIAALLPVGLLDSIAKKMAGLDVFEQKLKELGGVDALFKA